MVDLWVFRVWFLWFFFECLKLSIVKCQGKGGGDFSLMGWLPWFRLHFILLESGNLPHAGLHTNPLLSPHADYQKTFWNIHWTDLVPANLFSFILQHLLSYSILCTSPIRGLVVPPTHQAASTFYFCLCCSFCFECSIPTHPLPSLSWWMPLVFKCCFLKSFCSSNRVQSPSLVLPQHPILNCNTVQQVLK